MVGIDGVHGLAQVKALRQRQLLPGDGTPQEDGDPPLCQIHSNQPFGA